MSKQLLICIIGLLLLSSIAHAQKRKHRKNIEDTTQTSHDIWVYADKANNDTLWKKRVWRYVDLREHANAPLSFDTAISRDSNFIVLLISGLQRGEYKAYSTYRSDSNLALQGSEIPIIDTSGRTSLKNINVGGLEIMEDWMFLRSEGKMIVRIAAISPVAVPSPDKPDDKTNLFWLWYSDITNRLASHYIPVESKRLSYLDYFEKRMFASRITKVSPGKNE